MSHFAIHRTWTRWCGKDRDGKEGGRGSEGLDAGMEKIMEEEEESNVKRLIFC